MNIDTSIDHQRVVLADLETLLRLGINVYLADYGRVLGFIRHNNTIIVENDKQFGIPQGRLPEGHGFSSASAFTIRVADWSKVSFTANGQNYRVTRVDVS